ncbi:NAD(P)H-dependent oxidoreductase [uncultured Nitratireductor sp.]|uniref:NADPH-dependent FMN reductase n=1 Tax=uncultured Nitratireductor sp. TaxID=520953 RepID=UPI0025E9BD8F|nr:NAD(P)H-dependent oxidoreductase [uncultured Nitratireductor sp.]
MHEPIRIAVIYGSNREGRFCETVGNWVVGQLSANEALSIDVLDPLELGLPERMGKDEPASVKTYLARLAQADGFVVVMPEYNHGYPASLKHMIDTAYYEWRAKPVAFVSYGGIAGGLRAVEQLRLVFAELHAVGLRDGVSFANAWTQVDETGRFQPPVESANALQAMSGELVLWARALQPVRREMALAKAG